MSLFSGQLLRGIRDDVIERGRFVANVCAVSKYKSPTYEPYAARFILAMISVRDSELTCYRARLFASV